MKTEQKQLPLFQAETTWFHIFRHMIESGDLAKMGCIAYGVYSTVKAYTNWATGHAFPRIELIAEKTGLSTRQVMRSLQTLEEMGYLVKEKRGRTNTYTLREKITISDLEGRPAAAATWDYLPNGVREAQAELKNFLMTGDMAQAKTVHIENLTINLTIQNNAGEGTQNFIDPGKFPNIEKLVGRLERTRQRNKVDPTKQNT